MAAPRRETADTPSSIQIREDPASTIPNLALPVYVVIGNVDVDAHDSHDVDAHSNRNVDAHKSHDVDAQNFFKTLSNEVASNPTDFQLPRNPTNAAASMAFPWEALPYELLDQIFSDINIDAEVPYQYFRASAYYGMPALIVALRGIPKSYTHALQWFRNSNRPYNMNGAGGYAFDGMIAPEIAVLESLDITISNLGKNALVPHNQLITRPSSIAESFIQPFLKATSVKNVKMRLLVDDDYGMDQVNFISEFPRWLRGFKSLKSLQVKIPVAPWRVSKEKRKAVLDELMERIEVKVGVKGKCTSCYHTRLGGGPQRKLLIGDWEAEDWEWKANKGKVMDWSQDGIGLDWTFE